jgi:hypothetical protein
MTAEQSVHAYAKSLVPARDTRPGVAVLIPCFNEQATIAKVITDFRHELPQARIYVYDNNSVDAAVSADIL